MPYLSDRDHEILWEIAQGDSPEEIALQHRTTVADIEQAQQRLARKFRARSLANLVHVAWGDGVIGRWEDCGTSAAYSRHFRHKIPLDPKCSIAHRRDIQSGRIARRNR